VINITKIRNDIVAGLYSYMNIPVIFMQQNKPKPPYPFISYKITTPFTNDSQEILTTEKVASSNPNFDYDIQYTRSEQPQMTISITAYSKDIGESENKALEALGWFKFIGRDYLEGKGIVVVDTTAVQNRDTLIVDDYERRIGFDVILRVKSILTKTVETIEDTDIKRSDN